MTTLEWHQDDSRHTTLLDGQRITIKKCTEAELLKIPSFLHSLDDSSFAMRHGNYARHEIASVYHNDAIIHNNSDRIFSTFIVCDEKNHIIGATEFADDRDFDHSSGKGKVALCMTVIHPDYQGKGVAKKLFEVRDQCIRDKGYYYQTGSVYRENGEQQARLCHNGWNISLSDDSDFVDYWKPLKEQCSNIDPFHYFSVMREDTYDNDIPGRPPASVPSR